MADIMIAGSLIPSKVDTPLDKRSRVATLADVASIENPVLGGIFYCVATGKLYRITALKNKALGALTVANAQVDTYEEIPSASALRTIEDRISSVESDLGDKASSLNMEAIATEVSRKANSSDVSALAERVSSAETAHTALAGRVTDAETAHSTLVERVADDETAHTALAGRVSDAETEIATKASSTSVETLAGRVTTAEGAIEEHATSIATKASNASVETLTGRVADDEAVLAIKADAEVTKFEVYATNADITAGTVDADTGLAYAVDVPAGMTHTFKLRSDTPQAKQDVVIDWGDGVISDLNDGDFDSLDDSEYAENGELVYIVSHEYTEPGKYIVTISGKEYWGMQTKNDYSSILSRIFAADLPVASCVTNTSLIAQYSKKLQKVLIPTGMDFFTNIHNASGMFINNKNLLSVTNMATKFQYTRYVQNMFNGCEHMASCDFRIPPNCLKADGTRSVYKNCAALTADIASLLPERGFDGTKLNFLECFRGCASLTGTVPAEFLWKDKRITWQNTANVFTGCSAEIRAQVPVSWGGTAAEPEVGAGNIVGGYTAKILTYEETTSNDVTTYSLYLDQDLNNEVDYTKFKAGNPIRISLIESDEFAEAVVSAVDSTNKRLKLTASLYGTSITSNSTIGMEKKAVSGYTASATGGPSVYRVTYSGAGTDDELFEGRTVYTRAGSGAFVSNSIAGTSGNYIYLSSAAAGTTAIYLAPSPAFVLAYFSDPEDTATASGEYNMVAGEASSAAGAYNAVSGIGNAVSGSVNTVQGDNNFVLGDNNNVSGFSVTAIGGSNTVLDGNMFVIGKQNKAYKQGAILLGDMNVALAVNAYAFGWGNQLKAHGVMGVGTRNTITGKYSVAVGYSNKVAAETAYVVGRYANIPDAAENKNGFFVWGGHYQDNALALAVRVFRKELNPLFNGASLAPGYSASDPNPKDSAGERKYESVPAYRTEYKGQLKPMTQTIAISGTQTVTLDPTLYSRVILTGSGAVNLDLEDYAEDGDSIQLVLDSNSITPSFPAEWETTVDVSKKPGLYVLEIAKVQSTVICKITGSASGGGSNSGLAAGCVVAWAATRNVPDGFLYCDGSAVSRSTYADLFSAISTTYGAGDGATTFRIPDFRSCFLRGYQSGITTEIGHRQREGLPNITGGPLETEDNYDPWGAIYRSGTHNVCGDRDRSRNTKYFDASRSNSIYGASEHVTPENNAILWIIKY